MTRKPSLVLNAIVSAAIGAGVMWLLMRDGTSAPRYSGSARSAADSGADNRGRIGVPERFVERSEDVPGVEIGSLPQAVTSSTGPAKPPATKLPPVAEGPGESTRTRATSSPSAIPVVYQLRANNETGRVSAISTPISRATQNGIATALANAEQFAAPFEKEGFTRREDYWGGILDARDKAITQQLFRGNEYWFCAGTDVLGAEIDAHVYDSDGNLVETAHQEGPRAAAVRVNPKNSGAYYVIVSGRAAAELSLPAGQAVHWAVTYGYR
jgi:hypothetical protein